MPEFKENKSPAMKRTPYKMKGSPMQRNFGISPVKHFTGEEHPKDDPKHKKSPPTPPSDTTTTKKTKDRDLAVGTLNEDKTKKWDGNEWVVIRAPR